MAAISGATASRSSMGMRPSAFVSLTLEGITERNLDQARIVYRRRNLREVRVVDVLLRDCRTGKVRVIPDVEEIGRKPQLLPLRNREALDQRKVPVLLTWPTIQIAPQIAE